MAQKPVAVVLGGSAPHVEFIKKLKKRGYYTVLVDYFDNPPAKAVADKHIQESTLDLEKVLKISREYNAKLVTSGVMDQANITACFVAEQMGLTKPYSYEFAKNITNKGYMKKVMRENNIPTSKFIYLDKDEEIGEFDLSYPIMVKPADSNGANGVKKANSPEEMQKYLVDAKKISRNGRTIVEEFKSGIEVNLYCFVFEEGAHLLHMSRKFGVLDGEKQVVMSYSAISPISVSEKAAEKISKMPQLIADAFCLKNVPLLIQIIVDGDDVNVIEFMPRTGGGMAFEVVRIRAGFDVLEATIDSFLGIDVLCDVNISEDVIIVQQIYAMPGIFGHVGGVDELLDRKVIDRFHYHKTKGMAVTDSKESGGRIAAVIIRAADINEALQKVKMTIETLEVYDTDGKPMMRKDLYLTKQKVEAL